MVVKNHLHLPFADWRLFPHFDISILATYYILSFPFEISGRAVVVDQMLTCTYLGTNTWAKE